MSRRAVSPSPSTHTERQARHVASHARSTASTSRPRASNGAINSSAASQRSAEAAIWVVFPRPEALGISHACTS